jgi:hypothetical protein
MRKNLVLLVIIFSIPGLVFSQGIWPRLKEKLPDNFITISSKNTLKEREIIKKEADAIYKFFENQCDAAVRSCPIELDWRIVPLESYAITYLSSEPAKKTLIRLRSELKNSPLAHELCHAFLQNYEFYIKPPASCRKISSSIHEGVCMLFNDKNRHKMEYQTMEWMLKNPNDPRSVFRSVDEILNSSKNISPTDFIEFVNTGYFFKYLYHQGGGLSNVLKFIAIYLKGDSWDAAIKEVYKPILGAETVMELDELYRSWLLKSIKKGQLPIIDPTVPLK